jgi:hypothetical protein
MDISYDRMTWFAGGSSSAVGRGGAVISAVGLNRNLNKIRTQNLDQYGLQAVTAIKRMPMNDDLVVGGFQKMLIVTWTGIDFQVNKVIENVHTSKKPLQNSISNLILDIFSDIALYDSKIYSVCRDDQYIAQTTLR